MGENCKEQEIKLTFETPGTGKILSTHLFDWFISMVLGFILLIGTFAIVPLFPSYQNALKERNEILVSSSLYVKKEDRIIPLINSISGDESLSLNEKSKKLDTSLSYFFLSYIDRELEGRGKDTYLALKKEAKINNNPLFDKDGNRTYTNPDYDKDYYSFYTDTYSKKALGYLSLKKGYSSSRHTILWTTTSSILSTFLFSFLIFYLIVPLIFPRGKRTLGMLLLKTALVGKNGFSCSLPRFVFHALFEIIFIIIGSVVAFLIPLAISVTMIILRKIDHQSLTDYVAGTYVVSISENRVYQNVYEYLEGEHKANSSRFLENKETKLL